MGRSGLSLLAIAFFAPGCADVSGLTQGGGGSDASQGEAGSLEAGDPADSGMSHDGSDAAGPADANRSSSDGASDAGMDIDAGAHADTGAGQEAGACSGPIQWRDTRTAIVYPTGTSVSLDAPPTASPGQLLVAVLAVGQSSNTVLPVFTPPAGWTLARRIDRTTVASLAIYWKLVTSSEPPNYAFTSDQPVLGTAWLSLYSGVDPASPVDNDNGQLLPSIGTAYATPVITTSVAGEVLVLSYAAIVSTPAAPFPVTTWTAPGGVTSRANLDDSYGRSSFGGDIVQAAAGPSQAFQATASTEQKFAMTHVLALRPCK